MGPILLGAVLLAIFLLIVAAMLWQEARSRPIDEPPTYVLEEAVRYIFPRLGDEAMARLDVDDVRRILEWEVVYLQGVTPKSSPPLAPIRVAGGSPEAVAFIRAQAQRAGGHDYDPAIIAEVLRHEAAYLRDIGAVGPPLEEGP